MMILSALSLRLTDLHQANNKNMAGNNRLALIGFGAIAFAVSYFAARVFIAIKVPFVEMLIKIVL